MKTVYKYKIPVQDYFELELPRNAEPLSVFQQGSDVCMWVKLDDSDRLIFRNFRMAGTGHPLNTGNLIDFESDYKFIGTFTYDKILVFHLFEIVDG